MAGSTLSLTLKRHARYQLLRTMALRLLFTTGPLAVIGGVWYWLGPDTFAPFHTAWTITTGILVSILIVVELMKWPLPKYQVVLDNGGAGEVLIETKYIAEARSFLMDYAGEHGIADTRVTDVTAGKRG